MAKPAKKKRIIKVDFTDVEARVLVPEGDYKVLPVAVETDEGENFPYHRWTLEIQEGDYRGKKLYDNTSESPKALWRLRNMLEAMKIETVDGLNELDMDDIISEASAFFVTVEHQKNDNKTYARVIDVFANDEEDEPEEPEEKEKPKEKSKKKEVEKKKEEEEEELDFTEMSVDQLEEFIDEHDLDVDLDDYKKLSAKQTAVAEAYEQVAAAGQIEEKEKPGKAKKYSEDDIKEMGTKELQKVIEEAGLDVELEGTTSGKRRTVIKALRKAGKLEE